MKRLVAIVRTDGKTAQELYDQIKAAEARGRPAPPTK
jgi:hypothetical protein